MMTRYITLSSLNRTLGHSVMVGAIATISLISGVVPSLAPHSPTLVFGAAAHAEDFSDADITKYAQAVLAVEPIRQNAYAEIKRIVGSGDIPNIVCNQSGSLEAISRDDVRRIAVNYCNQSQSIIANYLPISRFNTMTNQVQSDSDLQKRVQNELLRLQ